MQSEIEEYPLTKVKLDNLVFDKTNPNRPSKEVIEGIRKSILEFGLVKPIVINEKMEIADGEHRALVWKALGKTDIQAYIVPKLNDDIKRRLARQTLNKLQGEHDIKLDADEMALIFEAGQLNNLAELIAQGRESLENILTKHKGIMFQHEDNFEVDKALEDLVPTTQLGDIWQLGEHKIICADCTDKRSIDRLLEDKKPDLIFADPPYNIGFNYDEYEDTKSKPDYQEFCTIWFKALPECNKKVITPGPRNVALYEEPADIGTWYKPNSRSGASAFNFRTCEPILFYGKFSDNKRLTDFFEYSRSIDAVKTASEKAANVEEVAPAKPILLLSDILESWSKEGDFVFDPFLGSGSTLIACEQTNRICMGVEIDPHYCDVVVKRWEAYTGAKATLLPREAAIV